jgi:hypothetical protein
MTTHRAIVTKDNAYFRQMFPEPAATEATCEDLRQYCVGCAGGMVGELRAPGGEICPMLVTAPFQLGEDITTNSVCCAAYCNPPHQRHTCRPLPEQSLEVPPPPPPARKCNPPPPPAPLDLYPSDQVFSHACIFLPWAGYCSIPIYYLNHDLHASQL